jgi:hypothetical protein
VTVERGAVGTGRLQVAPAPRGTLGAAATTARAQAQNQQAQPQARQRGT